MEKDYNLQCIDYAMEKNIKKAQEDVSLRQLSSCYYLKNAMIEYIFRGNARGFTRKDNGRSYITQLQKEDFEEQLLKHVVKSENAKERLGMVQLLSFNKEINDQLSDDEVRALFYKLLGEMDMNGILYILNKYPSFYSSLASNFISDRYLNSKLGSSQLDQKMNHYQNQFYYNKIDQFYKELKKEKQGSKKI